MTNSTNKTNKSKDTADWFITNHQEFRVVLKNIDKKEVSCYATWLADQWNKMTPCDLDSEIDKPITQNLGPRESYNSLMANTRNQIISRSLKTEEADWDVSLNSIPLEDGNRSIDCTGNIIATPKDELMLKRIPVLEADIPTASEFQNSETNKLLHDWLHQDQIDFLQIALGQALIGNPLHLILLFIGRGRNGKSLFLKYLYKTFGDLTKTIPPDYFTIKGNQNQHPTGLMGLRTARFITLGELEDANTRLAGGRLKSLTGGDKFQARGIGQDALEFEAIGIPIIFGNHDPKLTDMSVGFRKRLKYIAFENEFTDDQIIPEPHLNKIIQSEKGHFLHWILEGLKKYNAGDMSCPALPKVEEDTERYLENENSLAEVINMFLVPANENAGVKISDLLAHMKEHKITLPGISNTPQGIRKEMQTQKYPVKLDSKHGNKLMGYIFKTEYQAETSEEAMASRAEVAKRFKDTGGGY